MKATNNIYKTDKGTFTRKTARTYTHLIVRKARADKGEICDSPEGYIVENWCGREDLAIKQLNKMSGRKYCVHNMETGLNEYGIEIPFEIATVLEVI